MHVVSHLDQINLSAIPVKFFYDFSDLPLALLLYDLLPLIRQQYQDYQAIQGETHQYCIESINNCGNSEFICTYGSRKNVPNPVGFINASDGEFQDYIQIEWEEVNDNLTYKLFRDGVQLSVIGANQETLYVDQFVEPEIIYDYCVLAENDCGESNLSCDEGFLAIGSIGDVNLDQEVDVLDIVLLLNFIIEVQTNYGHLKPEEKHRDIIKAQYVVMNTTFKFLEVSSPQVFADGNVSVVDEIIDSLDSDYACKNVDLIVLHTEWDEFKTYNWDAVFEKIKKPAFIYDGRNILNVENF